MKLKCISRRPDRLTCKKCFFKNKCCFSEEQIKANQVPKCFKSENFYKLPQDILRYHIPPFLDDCTYKEYRLISRDITSYGGGGLPVLPKGLDFCRGWISLSSKYNVTCMTSLNNLILAGTEDGYIVIFDLKAGLTREYYKVPEVPASAILSIDAKGDDVVIACEKYLKCFCLCKNDIRFELKEGIKIICMEGVVGASPRVLILNKGAVDLFPYVILYNYRDGYKDSQKFRIFPSSIKHEHEGIPLCIGDGKLYYYNVPQKQLYEYDSKIEDSNIKINKKGAPFITDTVTKVSSSFLYQKKLFVITVGLSSNEANCEVNFFLYDLQKNNLSFWDWNDSRDFKLMGFPAQMALSKKGEIFVLGSNRPVSDCTSFLLYLQETACDSDYSDDDSDNFTLMKGSWDNLMPTLRGFPKFKKISIPRDFSSNLIHMSCFHDEVKNQEYLITGFKGKKGVLKICNTKFLY